MKAVCVTWLDEISFDLVYTLTFFFNKPKWNLYQMTKDAPLNIRCVKEDQQSSNTTLHQKEEAK